jgi:hypothetical protein
MIPLTLRVAILDEPTRRTCLETSTSLFAAIGTADVVDLVHIPTGSPPHVVERRLTLGYNSTLLDGAAHNNDFD